MDLYKFQMWCNDCTSWVIIYAPTIESAKELHNQVFEPDHTFDDSKTAILESILQEGPKMDDGRPIIRADTRPLNTSTYFTMCGDDSTSIGNGTEIRWDFSNDDNLYTGSEVPSGYKAKEFLISFHCAVNMKDGTVYFFDAPWGCYVKLDIVVPAGNFYPNSAGTIPASMLGLPGTQMYSFATENTVFATYVAKHFMYGSCPMGDELNSEGCSVDSLPVGWFIRGLVITPESDNTSKGFASLEMYRCHTCLLPGQTVNNIH